MLICMRTTLNLDDNLMRAAKRRAAETGQTLSETIEAALRELLEQEKRPKPSYRLRWLTVKGGAQRGVDLADRDALIDRMEGRT
jgi:plasmid stability protein